VVGAATCLGGCIAILILYVVLVFSGSLTSRLMEGGGKQAVSEDLNPVIIYSKTGERFGSGSEWFLSVFQ